MRNLCDTLTTNAVLALLLSAGQAQAATCQVPGDYATIQNAVDDFGCDPIVVAAGNFPDPVTVNRGVEIRGAGQNITIIGDTVTVAGSAAVTLRSLSIQFASGDGILLDSKFATVRGEDIEVSFSAGYGVDHSPTATDALADLRNCRITDNQRGVNARLIFMDSCTVAFNSPLGGVAVGLGGTIRNSVIQANLHTTLTGDGGGILFDGPGGTVLDVEDSFILSNISNSSVPDTNTSDGGGIMNRRGFLFVRRTEISGNIAGRRGGGIANSDLPVGANVEVFDSVVDQNIAFSTGGGIGGGDQMEVYRSTISFNLALYDAGENANGLGNGGGIYQFVDSLILEDSRVVGNQARSETGEASVFDGGGIYVNTDQLTEIRRSSILDNTAANDGGGIWINSPSVMENVTFAGNAADGDGGGIFGGTAPSIAHGTIVDNTAGGNGGGIASSATLNHSVIGHNGDTSPAPEDHPDCSGNIVSTGFSLLRIADGCPAFNGGSGNDSGSAGSPLSLGLIRPAADNGGPAETVALDSRSPAVDAGDRGCETAVSTDARGFSRAAQDGDLDGGADGDRCDLGAYEIFSGCQSAPLLLQGFLFQGADSITTEAALSTAPTVTVGDSGEVRLFAGDQVSFGTGFSVLTGGALEVRVGSFTCD